MKIINKILSAAVVSASITGCTVQPTVDERVDELYGKMSQEERIAQLHGMYMAELFDENDKLDTAKCAELIPNGVGHFSQFAFNQQRTPDQIRDMVAQLQDWLINHTPNGIPAIFHEEVLTGVNTYDATVYPQQIGLACSFNPELAEVKTRQTAQCLRMIGGTLALSPMVDVVRNPSFNRLEESYGEDGYLSAAMGVAFVKGLQTGGLKQGVAACTKHFLGYGGGGDAPEKELMEDILLPHEAIIRLADSKVVMTGYHAIDGTKCVANRDIQQGILRDYLNYDGIMVSDYGSIEQIGDSLNDVQRAAAALKAGNDVDFPEGNSYRHLPEALEQGLITEADIETAVKRVLKMKFDMGLFDADVPLYAEGHIEFDSPAERQTSYELATQSVVLLKNDNQTLPLKEPKNIALVGPNANTMWAMCGDYTYQAMRFFWRQSIESDQHPRIVGLRQGMEERLPEGFNLSYSRGCDWTEVVETLVEQSGDPRVAYLKNIQNRMIDSGEEANWDEAIQMAAQQDVIIAAMGENAILCGENRDRTHLRLPGRQEEFVRQLIATGKPVVLIMFGGRAQVIGDLADQCAAVIQAWYPGEEGGNALADILYGKVSPSGKLSVTYPAKELHEPLCYGYGIMPGDERVAWPFGYGLTYSQFEYSDMKVEGVEGNACEYEAQFYTVSMNLTNTGNVEATEVVQLYLSPLERSMKHKPIQLQGFKRVTLKPGESQTVTLRVSAQQLGYYIDGHWQIDPGRYLFSFGPSSQELPLQAEAVFNGEGVSMPLRTTYFSE